MALLASKHWAKFRGQQHSDRGGDFSCDAAAAMMEGGVLVVLDDIISVPREKSRDNDPLTVLDGVHLILIESSFVYT